MTLITILLTGATVWVLVLAVAISLCKAAKAGDRSLGAASLEGEQAAPAALVSRQAAETADALGVDLRAHRRPTGAHASAESSVVSVAAEPRLTLAEAAQALSIESEVLLAWEARYRYPLSDGFASGTARTYSEREVIALASALRSGASISAAIDAAKLVTNRRYETVRRRADVS